MKDFEVGDILDWGVLFYHHIFIEIRSNKGDLRELDAVIFKNKRILVVDFEAGIQIGEESLRDN